MLNQSFVFVGCEGFELTPEMLRVRDRHRDVQFSWAMLEGAGIALRDREHGVSLPSGEGAVASAMQQLSGLRGTHDALWIKHGAGLIIAVIEREHPKRDALLRGLEQHLGSHWFGGVFTSADLAQRFSYRSASASAGISKQFIIMGAAMLVLLAVAVLLAMFH
jgi:hypothetical protein